MCLKEWGYLLLALEPCEGLGGAPFLEKTTCIRASFGLAPLLNVQGR